MYYNYYQQPYFQPQPQPMQNAVYNIPKISGRVVNNIAEVTASEVPMDGSVSLFPSTDYSVIYAKAWNSEGKINTVKYVPEKVEEKTPEPSIVDAINKRFDNLEKLLGVEGAHE